ncbi:PepSY domain-containing protein [Streptomyces sp. NPDC006172]|uniref:PepSY domain-containing protein n=1 Tax=Streptomyces sp. NPDC006172 TaxID=3154470 RepID=UPI0033F62A1D
MKRKLVIAAVAASVAIGGGTAVAFADDGVRGATHAEAGDARAGVSGAKVTADQAIAAALKAQPGTVVSAGLDDDGADRGWEIDVLGEGTTAHTVLVDAADGRILGKETDGDDADDVREARALLKDARVTAGDAARAAAGKGAVTSVELYDDGRGGWDVETTDAAAKEHDWTVDLKSAKLTPDGEGGDADDDQADGREAATDGGDAAADHRDDEGRGGHDDTPDTAPDTAPDGDDA